MMKNVVKVRISADLEELIPEYLQRRWADAEQLRDCLQRGDYKELGHIGHRIKGSGAAYELDTISDIGLQIERHAKSTADELVQQQIERLESFLTRVEVEFV